jgi:hypothetical protein
VSLGADTLEVEYRDGYEEVVACVGALGREIARLGSGTTEAKELRSVLYASSARPRRLVVEGHEYLIRAEIYEDFGEDAFRVKLGRGPTMLTKSATARRRGPRS